MTPVREGDKRRRRLFFVIFAIGCTSAIAFGCIAGIAFFPGQPLRGAVFGALAAAFPAVLINLLIVGAEVFLPRTRVGRALERAPFLAVLAIKSIAYGTIVIAILGSRIGRWTAAYLLAGPEAAQQVVQSEGLPVAVSITVVFLLIPAAVMMVQMAGLVGTSTLLNIALGRYHRSHVEERFFLFIDVVGSTALAEKLGPESVHRFLDRVFQVASDPIDDHAGEVHQYVGDEVVITWTLAEGRPNARPIACYFAVKRALESAAPNFEREFGVVPRVRAALHAGPVITGEIGGSRRAIVFHGDVMNTTSRIENATRELKRPFLVSGDALSRVEGKEVYALEDLGPQQLRGRESPVQVYAVSETLPLASGA